jgi:hypothetical protein
MIGRLLDPAKLFRPECLELLIQWTIYRRLIFSSFGSIGASFRFFSETI